MANFGAGDVPALLRDLGVDVTVAAVTVKGIVDRDDRPIFDADGMGGVIARGTRVTVQTGTLPGLAVGAAITVDGESFLVSSVLALEDGELTLVSVAKS